MKPIFADNSLALDGLYLALTALVYALITIVQTVYQRWDARQTAKPIADKVAVVAEDLKVAKTAAAETKEAVKDIHQAINGNGLLGKLEEVKNKIVAHEEIDEQRHTDNLAVQADGVRALERLRQELRGKS